MRNQSRVGAFKVIFSTLFGSEPELSQAEILEEENLEEKDGDFASQIVSKFLENRVELDNILKDCVENYELSRIYKVDLALIYLGATEMLYIGTPKPVVVNEVVEIAKKFSTENSQKFINGVLAKVAVN